MVYTRLYQLVEWLMTINMRRMTKVTRHTLAWLVLIGYCVFIVTTVTLHTSTMPPITEELLDLQGEPIPDWMIVAGWNVPLLFPLMLGLIGLIAILPFTKEDSNRDVEKMS